MLPTIEHEAAALLMAIIEHNNDCQCERLHAQLGSHDSPEWQKERTKGLNSINIIPLWLKLGLSLLFRVDLHAWQQRGGSVKSSGNSIILVTEVSAHYLGSV